MTLRAHTGQVDPHLAEVDLALPARLVRLRNKRLRWSPASLVPDLRSPGQRVVEVVLMHETYVTDEVWAFDCRRCSHHWSVAYQVHYTEGFEGGELCLWSRNGLSSMAPEAGNAVPALQRTAVGQSFVIRGYQA